MHVTAGAMERVAVVDVSGVAAAAASGLVASVPVLCETRREVHHVSLSCLVIRVVCVCGSTRARSALRILGAI